MPRWSSRLLGVLPLFAHSLLAEPADFTGTWQAPGPEAIITLELVLDDDGALRGAMSDGVTRFEIAGRADARTLSGQAFNVEAGEMLGLLALLDPQAEWLALALIPFDTNREPLPALAEELAFRRAGVRPPPAP